MIKIGITGGIGSGKSFVAKQMEEKGIPVYYTDDMAKQLMGESSVIHEKLTELNTLSNRFFQLIAATKKVSV